MLDAVPCSDSTTCYAIVQPKALNQGYVLSKNGSGVWYRADGYKLMKQSPYGNQYLNVSDNVALLAIGYDAQFASYYSNLQNLFDGSLNFWSEYTDPDNGSGSQEVHLGGTTYFTTLGVTFFKPNASIGFKKGTWRFFAGANYFEVAYYSLL